jgi:spore photoproduct lyase
MPEEIAFISFGTLTYIKPVVQKIRKRMIKSKILQMSLVDVAGKLSYPDNIKRELFALAYQSFKNWHDQIFFYFCMEPSYIWEDIFGFDYRDNDQFESAKIDALFKKIRK